MTPTPANVPSTQLAPDGASATPEVKPPPVDLAALAASRSLPSMDDHAGFGDLVDASVPMEQGALGVTRAPAMAPPPPPRLDIPAAPVVFDQADFTDMALRPASFEAIPSVDAEPAVVVELPSNPRQLPFRPFGRSATDASPDGATRPPSFPPPTPQELIDAEMEPIDVPDSE